MGDFRVLTDGSGDIPAEVVKARDISVINFFVMLGSGEYLQQGVDIGDDEFYEWMVTHPGVYPKSSTPSTQDYLKVFTEIAKAGEKAVVLCITEKFSNSYQTACIALDLLREDYPDAQITVINSMVNTVLQGLMVLEACNMRDAGVPYETAVERIYEIRPTGRIFFTIGSMDYLAAGGRIGQPRRQGQLRARHPPRHNAQGGRDLPRRHGPRPRQDPGQDALANAREYLKETFTSREPVRHLPGLRLRLQRGRRVPRPPGRRAGRAWPRRRGRRYP